MRSRRRRGCTPDVGVPPRHRVDCAHASLANGCRRTEGIAIEGAELESSAEPAHGLDQEREVIAPVAGEDRLRSTGLNLGGIGQEVLDAPQRMQFIADVVDVGSLHRQQRKRLPIDLLAEAVALPHQMQLRQCRIAAHDLRQRRQAHIGMGIEAIVPGTARVPRPGRARHAATIGPSVLPLLSMRSSSKRRLPLASNTPPRRLIRSTAHSKLRQTASPALA